jgi:hypothetical protein
VPERRAELDTILTAATDADQACRARREALEDEVRQLLRRVAAHPEDRHASGRLWTLVEEHRLATGWGQVAAADFAVATRAVDRAQLPS